VGKRLYALMHRDDEVVRFYLDTETGRILEVGKHGVTELLPLRAKHNPQAIKQWWNDRAVPLTRKGITAALNILELTDTTAILGKGLGLSLNDHYWIQPFGEYYKWRDINLYQNTFTDELGVYQFAGDSDSLAILSNKTIFIPSASLGGELQKKWLIDEEGARWLAKGNYGLSCQQSINEVFASLLHEKQGKPHTPYVLTTLDTSEGPSLGCMSKNFATEQLEFIPAYEVIHSEPVPNGVSIYEHFIQVCVQNGLVEETVRSFLEYQIVTDYIMTNTDRHFNNFGVLRDTNSLRFTQMAPIYDTGNSMFWKFQSLPEILPARINVTSFRPTEGELLKYVKDSSSVDVRLLPSEDEFYTLYRKDKNISEERLLRLLSLYNQKIAKFAETFVEVNSKDVYFKARRILGIT